LIIVIVLISSAYHTKSEPRPGSLIDRGAGSFTDAANHLHLTQPAISQQSRKLENRCALRLVERVGKRAIATPAGCELIAHGKQIIADSEHARAAVRFQTDGAAGRVHVGAGPTASLYLLPPVLRKTRILK
jgi:DNA-binding transcriptional LysR family regulator